MEDKWVYTACPGWGDHDFCVLKTVVKDGVIDHTEKVQYTGLEAPCGHICQKGIAAARQPYNPERLLKPLKRVGERGEGKWEEISWDQALDEIGAKLVEIRDEYGPQAVCVWNLGAGSPPSLGLSFNMAARFTAAFGATDAVHRQGLDNGAQYSLDVDLGGGTQYFSIDPRVMEDAEVVIVWGANPIENQMRVAMSLVEARSRGAKIIDIGLVYDGTAGFADEFIPVKPASDAALALAMAKIIVDEELYDADFVSRHTVAPFLVSESDGRFVRDEMGNYLAWNAEADEVEAIPPHWYDHGADHFALEGSFTVNGVACKPAFQLLTEHLAQYTPEYQEAITGVPAAECIELAHTIAAARATFFDITYGMRYLNQGESHRAVTLLAALTGNLGNVGGGCGYSMNSSSWPIVFNAWGMMAPRGVDEKNDFIGPNYVTMADFFEGAKTGKYKAFIKAQGNPVHNNPNRARWIEDTFPNMELIVDYDIWLTDTGEYADYVLPDCMPFERSEIINLAAYGHIMLQEPAIEPVGDNKPPVYFYTELAKRVGLADFFQKTEEEYLAEMLTMPFPFPPFDNLEPPLTWERLKTEKMIRAANPNDMPYNPFMGQDFTTDSGRVEFYAEDYAEMGEAMAVYRPSIEFPIEKEKAEYPYQFFSGRQRFFMQSMFTDDPLMREMSGGEPLIRINPADAEAEGLVTGDYVEAYNDRGHVCARLRLDEAVPPGTVHAWFGWRARAYENGTYAELTVPCGGAEATDALAERWWELETGGSIGAMMAGHLDMLQGTWDTLWDAACAIRKIDEKGAENE